MNIRYPIYEGVYRILTFILSLYEYKTLYLSLHTFRMNNLSQGMFERLSFQPKR